MTSLAPDADSMSDAPAAPAVTLRFFAAARAAVGRDTLTVPLADDATGDPLPPGATVTDALDYAVASLSDETARAHAAAVFRRCTFLVDGVAVPDGRRAIGDASLIDVMPPFAGG